MDRQAERLNAAADALGDEESMAQRGALYTQYDAFMNRCLSTEERFHTESFTHAVYLFDVWDTTQLFGRKLSSDERIARLKILMPPDFVQRKIFGLPFESYKDTTLQEERQQQIRDILGDDIFNHFENSVNRGGTRFFF